MWRASMQSEHAEEHVRADTVSEAVVHGPDLERVLQLFERVLVDLQALEEIAAQLGVTTRTIESGPRVTPW